MGDLVGEDELEEPIEKPGERDVPMREEPAREPDDPVGSE